MSLSQFSHVPSQSIQPTLSCSERELKRISNSVTMHQPLLTTGRPSPSLSPRPPVSHPEWPTPTTGMGGVLLVGVKWKKRWTRFQRHCDSALMRENTPCRGVCVCVCVCMYRWVNIVYRFPPLPAGFTVCCCYDDTMIV